MKTQNLQPELSDQTSQKYVTQPAHLQDRQFKCQQKNIFQIRRHKADDDLEACPRKI